MADGDGQEIDGKDCRRKKYGKDPKTGDLRVFFFLLFFMILAVDHSPVAVTSLGSIVGRPNNLTKGPVSVMTALIVGERRNQSRKNRRFIYSGFSMKLMAFDGA